MDTKDALQDCIKPKTERIGLLSIGHLVNDLYMNQIQVMIPFWILAGLSASQGGFLVAAFTITSSLTQPLFGLLSDRKSYHWLIFSGTAWMAILLSLIGLSNNYLLLLLIASLAGLGTAAFHPQASAMVSSYSGNRKSFAQAIFIAAGNMGWALTPLLVVPLIYHSGLKITPVFVIPGLVVSFLLWILFRNQTVIKQTVVKGSSVLTTLRQNAGELTTILLIVALRSLTYFSLISFLPIYLKQHGIPLTTSSWMISLMLFSGSIGGLMGGFMADKYGRKVILISSLTLATPFFILFLVSSGWINIVFLALAGACLLATFSITVTAAHKIIRNNAGFASGLTLGFGTGIGGLGVGLMGIITDTFGINITIYCLVGLPLVAGLLGFKLKMAIPELLKSTSKHAELL